MNWACAACGGDNPEGMRFCGHCGAPASGADPARPVADVSDALRSFVSEAVADRLIASGGEITEERRLVTALFADLSGFTPLADRLDPEELLEVIDPIIKRLTNIVGRYEGYVDKFAGDALLAFFGAPVAHEDDAHRALLVATEMHREIAAIVPELPEDAGELTLHIGVNSGRVVARVLGTDVRMDYSVLGDAVILAQRLESAAPAGQTYVGETTHLLTADSFDFESVGQLTLKGKAEPVGAYRLVGKKGRTGRGSSRFIGRAEEILAVDSAIASFDRGHGAVVSVSGEPGVGKSRFTEEVHHRATTVGARWLTARCLSYGSGIAYWPVSDLFRRIAGIAPTDPPGAALPMLRSALERAGVPSALPPLTRLLGFLAPEIEDLEPEAFRRLLHDSVIEAVRHVAVQEPLVLAVEDLHWGDASSVALIGELAELCSETPLIIYVTARTEAVNVLLEIASGAPELLRHAIQLDPMDPAAVAPLIEDTLGAPASPAVLEVINERAVGNPFFIQELLRSLRDSGEITRTNGHWDLTADFEQSHIPPTIEGVLSARIDMLPRPAAAALQVCSVIGRRVRLPLLSAVVDDADLGLNLKGLLDAGMLDEAEGDADFVFHHALVQDVAYSRLLRKKRRELHLRVAEEAERLYGAADDTIDLLARHLHLAGAGEKAVRYLIRAGDRAARLFANDEALIHLQHAADLARTTHSLQDLLYEVLLKIADLHALRGNYEEALRLFTEIRDARDWPRAWQGVASCLRNESRYVEALAVVDDAFERGSSSDELPELWLERGWILSRSGQFPEAVEALRSGLDALDHRQDAVAGHILMQLTRAETVVGDHKAALKHALAAVLIFEEIDDIKGFATALRILGDTYRHVDLLDDAVTALERGLELAERTGNIEEIAGCAINLGLIELARGNVDAAIEHDLRAAGLFERVGHSSGKAIVYGNLAEKYLAAGSTTEALDSAARATTIAEEIGHLPTLADVALTLATLHRAEGRLGDAIAHAERAAAFHHDMGAMGGAADALALAAEMLEESGDMERARELNSRAQELRVAQA